MSVVGGMVLAAGLSERMDGDLPKQLLPYKGMTLAGVTVANAEASRLDTVVVVTGHQSSAVAAALDPGRATVVTNPDYREGNMSSFRVGVAALRDCDAVLVLLADMPGVTTELINRHVAAWHESRPWAAVTEYSDGPAHPLLLSAPAVEQAATMQGANGVWRLLRSAGPGRVVRIAVDHPSPTDVNTAADYQRLLGEPPA